MNDSTRAPGTFFDRSRWLLLPGFLILVTVLALSARVRTDDPVSSSVRYTGEIIRILDRRCASCHSANAVSMPLSNYREVRDWGRAIREEIVEQRMPPWGAARGHTRFQHDLGLTARETATMLSWLDGGMPRGDDRELPTAPKAAANETPDLRLTIPPQPVPALEEHVIRRVTVDTNLTAAQLVSRVSLTPGNRRLLRGAFVFLDRDGQLGQWLGAWLPWQPRINPPASQGFVLPRGARLVVELHYRGDETAAEDRPLLEVYFPRKSTASPLEHSTITETLVDRGAPVRFAAPARIWALVPTVARETSSLEVSVRRPNGVVDVVLWIPEYRHDWPQALIPEDPIVLEEGATVQVSAEPQHAAARVRLSLLPADGERRSVAFGPTIPSNAVRRCCSAR